MKFKLKNGEKIEISAMSETQKKDGLSFVKYMIDLNEKKKGLLELDKDRMEKDIVQLKALKKELISDLHLISHIQRDDYKRYTSLFEHKVVSPFIDLLDKVYKEAGGTFEPAVIQKEIDVLQASKIDPLRILIKDNKFSLIKINSNLSHFRNLLEELQDKKVKEVIK